LKSVIKIGLWFSKNKGKYNTQVTLGRSSVILYPLVSGLRFILNKAIPFIKNWLKKRKRGN
jgi:hypothetical protein